MWPALQQKTFLMRGLQSQISDSLLNCWTCKDVLFNASNFHTKHYLRCSFKTRQKFILFEWTRIYFAFSIIIIPEITKSIKQESSYTYNMGAILKILVSWFALPLLTHPEHPIAKSFMVILKKSLGFFCSIFT